MHSAILTTETWLYFFNIFNLRSADVNPFSRFLSVSCWGILQSCLIAVFVSLPWVELQHQWQPRDGQTVAFTSLGSAQLASWLLPWQAGQAKTVAAFIRWAVFCRLFEGGATFAALAECCPYKHPTSKMPSLSDRLAVVERKCTTVPATRSQTNTLWIWGREVRRKTPNKLLEWFWRL